MHTKVFIILSWLSFLAVISGGMLYPVLVKKLSPFQAKFYKLGHAHGGVLTLASFLYYRYILQTAYNGSLKNWLAAMFLLGGASVAASFFWHSFIDKSEDRHSAMIPLAFGYTTMFIAVVFLCIGLARL